MRYDPCEQKGERGPETRPVVFPLWDAKGVAKVYLDALRQEAEAGPLDQQWLSGLLDQLVHALRSAYSPEDVERAVRKPRAIVVGVGGIRRK